MNKILELSDLTTLQHNKLQTRSVEIIRTGKINFSGIKLEYLDSPDFEILVTCEIDNEKTVLLLKREGRLPFGESRQQIVDNGLSFLFQDTSGEDYTWKLSFDLNDDDNDLQYVRSVSFYDDYTEEPLRDLLETENLEIRLVLYNSDKPDDTNGIAVIEIGNLMNSNSGLLYYYSYRTITSSDVQYL